MIKIAITGGIGSGKSTAAEEIKKINPKVNIIFVTVCGEREHAREVLRLKPSGYLTKPATQEQIMQELRELRYPVRYNNVGV